MHTSPYTRFRRSTCALFLALLTVAAATAATPVNLIFDTDFRTDVDDPGTLAMLHGLWNENRVAIIGVIATTAGTNVVAAIDAVNTYYGRPDIPIGIVETARATAGGDPYAQTLATTSLYPSAQRNATAPNATTLYRRLLAQAQDKSVVIVVVGGQNAVYDLMVSPAQTGNDGIAQTGLELIQAKVDKLVIMGGNFSSASATENNILRGVVAARQVAATWPTPIVYSGWEVGNAVRTGKALTNPDVNPVAKAYELFSGSGPVGVIGDRDSWDQTAALYAVVGCTYKDVTLWSLSAPHTITFDDAGHTIISPCSTANRYYMIKTLNNADLATCISALMIAAPRSVQSLSGTYRADAQTRVLYHFEEAADITDAGTPFSNAGTLGSAVNLTQTGGPDGRDAIDANGGGYGRASFPGLGHAFGVLRSGDATYHVVPSSQGGGALTASPIAQAALQGSDGAFTYEAVVKLTNSTAEQQILSMDGTTQRGFLFRVTNGNLSFYSGAQEYSVTLPTTGPHAFAPATWFHAAVTYSGDASATNNLTFYWTKMGSLVPTANRIGSQTLAADLPGSFSNVLAIGTTGRNPFRFECDSIDEVRISAIARAANEFLFGNSALDKGFVLHLR